MEHLKDKHIIIYFAYHLSSDLGFILFYSGLIGLTICDTKLVELPAEVIQYRSLIAVREGILFYILSWVIRFLYPK